MQRVYLLEDYVKPETVAKVKDKIDKCALKSIVPYLKLGDGNLGGLGGTVEYIMVACEDIDLAELGALGLDGLDEQSELDELMNALAESGQIKALYFGESIPEDKKPFSIRAFDLHPLQAIECFYTEQIYYIKILDFLWI